MRSNIVLIDSENVQPDSLQLLDSECFRVLLFIGANRTKLPVETVLAMRQLGTRAEYIQIAGNGPNALDFHIAYYMGVRAALEPTAYFHVVSKDTGFDPLIQHLRSKQIRADRVEEIREISLVKGAICKSPEDRIQLVADKLAQPKVTKPSSRSALKNSIRSYLRQPLLSDGEVEAVVTGLAERGCISVIDDKIEYAATVLAY